MRTLSPDLGSNPTIIIVLGGLIQPETGHRPRGETRSGDLM